MKLLCVVLYVLAAAPWNWAAGPVPRGGRRDERAGRGGRRVASRAYDSGQLRLQVEQTGEGLRVSSLTDTTTGREFVGAWAVPLFGITLRDSVTTEEVYLTANAGWQEATVTESAGGLVLHWANATDARLAGVSVTATATPDTVNSAWHWGLQVDCAGTTWVVRSVVFPELAVAELGAGSTVFYAAGPGVEKADLWHQSLDFWGFYPGWDISMQFLAAYDHEPASSGLYFALHDPKGTAKYVGIASQGDGQGVRFAFHQVAPNLVPGNGFTLQGEGVWQLLHGDWFDAARIYRDWVRTSAAWWPQLVGGTRVDTPAAMRELPAWTLACCGTTDVVPAVKHFQEYLGVPVGMHWYDWHGIPFDNDYPHYFPTQPGVPEMAADLKQANVLVMPYINGRLWDTRDQGLTDWQFTSIALPWATKDEQGNPVVETYASTESDGSPVRLAVMCPATALWQQTMKDVCMQLFTDVGVNGVYLDQISAAIPVACMADNHGHLPGGGSWWNEGYWQMLEAIRAAKPEGTFLTSEANAEVYAKWLDGFLVWEWQSNGMVPAFPAVYGGAVQMFGRDYRGDDTAAAMRIGQQLAFGEQLGWADPSIVDGINGPFFRAAVQTHWYLRPYFASGEMARPPRLEGTMPTVTADWDWYGQPPVTTDAVLAGAWRLPAARRVALIFTNVSDQPVTLTYRLDLGDYGLRSRRVRRVVVKDGVPSSERPMSLPRVETMRFAPRQVIAWELRW